MNNIFLCLPDIYTLTENLNGDKRLLVTDRQYAHNI